jgi:hypothetical protein
MKTEQFPLTLTEKGVSAKIRKASQTKAGKNYEAFVVEYTLFGKRKRVWRSNLADAKTVAQEACLKIANGDQSSLELKDTDRMAYVRAVEAVAPIRVPIDTACREYFHALQILGGKGSITEACRDFVKRNSVQLPKITVADASTQLQRQAIADGKSPLRLKQLANVLDQFAESFNCEVHTLTPKLIADYLTALTLAERSKRNHRDVIGFFNRWLVLRG